MKHLLGAILVVFVLMLSACGNYPGSDHNTTSLTSKPNPKPQDSDTLEYFYTVKATTSPGFGDTTFKLLAGTDVRILDFFVWTEAGKMPMFGFYLSQDLGAYQNITDNCYIKDDNGKLLGTTQYDTIDVILDRVVTRISSNSTTADETPMVIIEPVPILLSVFCDITLTEDNQSPQFYITGADWGKGLGTGAEYTMPPGSSWPEAKNLIFVMP
jgi:hypothetical protein